MNNPIMALAQMAMNRISSDPSFRNNPQAKAFADIMQRGDIHRAVPQHLWIDAEEWVCNFIADYGRQIFQIASTVLGDEAWSFIPYELERLVV